MFLLVRFAVCAVVTSAACYAPSLPSGAPCEPLDPQCPDGQTCRSGDRGFECTTGGGGSGTIDAEPATCFGTGLVRNLCLDVPPGMRSFSGSRTLETGMVGPAACTTIVAQPSGPSLCVVASTGIFVDAGATLRVVGPNPLVLIGELIDIRGTLDASGHRGIAGAPAIPGAGAQPECAGHSSGVDGELGDAGGGGAGGSFGGPGGNGGQGNGGPPGGVSGPIVTPSVLLGGCPGMRGGHGSNGGIGSGTMGGGPGGPAGGAVYAIATTGIQVNGTISASGGGGGGGGPGMFSGGGGGGGGAGGLIAFDAPLVLVAGSLHANGGGGGGGNGAAMSEVGEAGAEPVTPLASALGGQGGGGGGGDGGRGFALQIAPCWAVSAKVRPAVAVVVVAAQARSSCSSRR